MFYIEKKNYNFVKIYFICILAVKPTLGGHLGGQQATKFCWFKIKKITSAWTRKPIILYIDL